MFNKGSYNSLPYNRQFLTQSPILANARMVMESNKTKPMIRKYQKGSAAMAMGSKANGLTLKTGGKVDAGIVAYAPPVAHVLEKYANLYPSRMVMGSSADHALSGGEFIELVDQHGNPLILKPSDELIIDTCNMTVTLNGENAMKYFSDNSRFFLLNQGINDIIYTDNSNTRAVEIDVLWKDRWL